MGKLRNTEIVEPYLQDKNPDNGVSGDQILITMGGGGFLSAKRFIELIFSAINSLSKKYDDISFKILLGAYNQNEGCDLPNTEILKWTKYIQSEYEKSKFVISEAGYFTVHELLENKLPAILIPGCRTIDNQELRAAHWELNRLGYCALPESQEEKLIEVIENMYLNENNILEKMCKNSSKKLQERIQRQNIMEFMGLK